MRIAVLSDVRRPSLGFGAPHGLGRSMQAIATGLAERGHTVTFFAGRGSEFNAGRLLIHDHEANRIHSANIHEFDVVLDGSHFHELSRRQPDWPIVNRIGDLECPYQPPNAVVETPFMLTRYPEARLIRKGVDVARIPFTAQHRGFVAYMGQIIEWKGYRRALEVGRLAGRDVEFAGPNDAGATLPIYHGLLHGDEKWAWVGGAMCLVHPSVRDAAPRTPLEVAACGVPTLCLAGDGAEAHVEHGVTGFVCADLTEMAARIDEAALLDRVQIRQWVWEHHAFETMIDGYAGVLADVARARSSA